MKNDTVIITLRIPRIIHDEILTDLQRPHFVASERVGFIHARSKLLSSGEMIITVFGYTPVKDEDYLADRSVGARINSAAIREQMQHILDNEISCFHVHLHNHKGTPGPSSTDRMELPGIVKSFSNINDKPHGIIIFSYDSAYVSIKVDGVPSFVTPRAISIVGYPMKFIFPGKKIPKSSKQYDRQSFLGPLAPLNLDNVKVGIIGFGGGGSHVGQQLAHIGVKNITIFDNDFVEDTNLNRLVGAWFSDIRKKRLKIEIASRLIKKIFPKVNLELIGDIWQNQPERLQACDIVIGGVDTYIGRRDLEAECRRYQIPYIDMGMDVHAVENASPLMSGQVILSMPGMPCMTCLGFLTKDKLAKEAARYGNIGGRPQVIWPNGILASSAIGICIDLITGWTNQQNRLVYLSMNGNLQLLSNHVRLDYAPSHCQHYKLENTGPPKFKSL